MYPFGSYFINLSTAILHESLGIVIYSYRLYPASAFSSMHGHDGHEGGKRYLITLMIEPHAEDKRHC